jgi:hypothetical protein
MKTIHKFPLKLTDIQTVSMPHDAYILHVAFQRGQLCLWAIVDTDHKHEDRRIEVAGTGNPMPELFPLVRKHLGTVQGDGFVWHIFDVVHGIDA